MPLFRTITRATVTGALTGTLTASIAAALAAGVLIPVPAQAANTETDALVLAAVQALGIETASAPASARTLAAEAGTPAPTTLPTSVRAPAAKKDTSTPTPARSPAAEGDASVLTPGRTPDAETEVSTSTPAWVPAVEEGASGTVPGRGTDADAGAVPGLVPGVEGAVPGRVPGVEGAVPVQGAVVEGDTAGTVPELVPGLVPGLEEDLSDLEAVRAPATGESVAERALAAKGVNCSSELFPKVAARLEAKLRVAVRGRAGSISFALYDRERRLGCFYGSGRHYDSASTVKVTVVATLLRTAQAQKRGLTAREKSLARAAITRSDNAATSALWRQLGRKRVQRFLNAVGMRATKLDPGGRWGLTQITAVDQLRLLTMLTRKNDILTDKSRKYLLALMAQVVKGQRWGTPAGASSKVNVHVKNGWLPRATHGWRVHSLGTFDGSKHDYMFAVLTHGNSSLNYGITTIERISRVIHSTLVPESNARLATTPRPPEIGDGSAPFAVD